MYLIAFLDFAPPALQGAESSLLATLSALSQPAAVMVLTAVWQGAAVALGLALCLRLAPRSPARHRFALWGAGFGALVGLQLLPLISRVIPSHLQAVSSSMGSGMFTAAPPHPWLQLSATWSLVIASLWLATSAVRAADLAIHTLHLRRLWRSGIPVETLKGHGDRAQSPAALKGHGFGRAETAAKISGALAPEGPSFSDRCHRIFRRRAIQICTTTELERPSVIGFFAPRILIPNWLFSRLTPGELDQIVLHETEHLRRRDDWTNLLQKLCLVLFPLNPGLAWIERRLCREREMACDDGVIHITRAPRAYAACLASLAERGLQRRAGALSLGAWHARPELVRRVHSILRRNHALSPLAARAVLAATACLLLAGATALARCPRLVAFMPAHRASAPLKAHGLSHTENSAKISRASVPAGHTSSADPAQSLAALEGHGFRGAENSAKISRISVRARNTPSADPTQSLAALEEHGFSGAENSAEISGALAPSGSTPNHITSSVFTVMSAWETVEIVRPEDADKVPNATAQHDNVRVSGAAGVSHVQRISPRITVTRMYLKIYSSGDRESTWLVIQL